MKNYLPHGYAGYTDVLVQNFTQGRYLALPLLQWIGLALDRTERARGGRRPYPSMLKWLSE